MPHHVTQRGNRRQQTFFVPYIAYIDLMAEWCKKCEVELWAWCLMPNHVHLIAVGWRGHLWQERFVSFTMDESYLLAAARYVEMNPVAAGIVSHPGEYQWSSAVAHLSGQDDILTRVEPLLSLVKVGAIF